MKIATSHQVVAISLSSGVIIKPSFKFGSVDDDATAIEVNFAKARLGIGAVLDPKLI